MSVNLSPVGGAAAQFFTNSGAVLTGGKLYTYEAGTTTPATTYTTSAGNVAHTNPIIFDAAGRVPSNEIWLIAGNTYKFVLKDSNDVLIGTYDNINGNNDPAFSYYTPAVTSLLAPGPLTVKSALDQITNETSGATKVGFTGFKNQAGTVQDLANNDGSDWIGFLPAGTNATTRSGQDKMRDIVSVKDFGAVGDGTTDDSGAVQDAVDYLFDSGGNALYFPDGTYYFASTVNLPLDSRSLRIFGTSSAGFTYVRPGGSSITGAPGLATLFLLTSSNPAAGGNYGFEVDHLDFNGNDLGVVSAIKNVVGGSPARPVSIHNCHFNKFQKALSSDITSGTINNTGWSDLSITENTFQGNDLVIWGAGNKCWQNVAFYRNTAEQNGGVIFCDTGSFDGTLTIRDNNLESQPNILNVIGGNLKVDMSNNYFEANTGFLARVNATASGSITLGNNYYFDCEGMVAEFINCQTTINDNLEEKGIYLKLNYTYNKSKINNSGIVYGTGSRVLAFDPYCLPINTIAPSGLDSADFIAVSSTTTPTPSGLLNFENVDGLGSSYNYYLTNVYAGDVLVFLSYMRPVDATNAAVQILVAESGSGVAIGNTQLHGIGGVGKNEWVLTANVVQVTGDSPTFVYVRYNSTASIDYSDIYAYRIPSMTATSPISLFMPIA